ncbi:hypothetical protein ACFQ05_21570 [Amycolatopsis umgeniensis]|uniref:Beta/gamma crystallin n=1 Tax=Amycolatopsis umgeniensis TaxID=336628 RepID=A0A841BBK3_9PSEU|nr:hypothetical protein [Amycolatopsis umgeniensis]MBB5858209.1 hypothetical protein [Amycolatopsis umgeniensis]
MSKKVMWRLLGASAVLPAVIGATGLAGPAVAAADDVHFMTRSVSCASLSSDELSRVWHGHDRVGGWCFVDGGDWDAQPGGSINVHSYCAGDHKSLIRYKLRNDPYLYSSTADKFTCQPWDYNANIVKITRTK